MSRVFNQHGDEWDRTEDRPGWRSKDAWVGSRIGLELIGGSLRMRPRPRRDRESRR